MNVQEAKRRAACEDTARTQPNSAPRAASASSSEPTRPSEPTRLSEIWDGVERRRQVDRRAKPTGILNSLLGRGKRKRGRRNGEAENTYVDVYQRTDLWLLIAVLVLNVCDAFFTLVWLQKGGAEGNPIMNELIQLGDGVFLAQKCFVVGLWLVVLTVHKNFRIAKTGMWVLLALYSALLCYHLFLQLSGVSPVQPH